MNNSRNKFYIGIMGSLLVIIILIITAFGEFLANSKDSSKSGTYLLPLYLLAGMVFVASVLSIVVLVFTIKQYDVKIEKYKIKFIEENKKREVSALLMTILSSFLIFPLFVMLNAYLKSGLSSKQRKHAERIIRVKRVDKFLKQKAVIEFIKNNNEARVVIKDIIKLREEGRDTVFNCNLFILKILTEEKVDYKIIYGEKEVYYIGMNL